MITKETALSHAKELHEYLSAQELYEICACTDSLQVVRTQYVLDRRDTVVSPTQFDERLVLIDKERETILEDKKQALEQEQLVDAEKNKVVVVEETPIVE